MRVGIIGAGAMGTFFAYTLAQRQEVTLLDVRADVIETIASNGVARRRRPRAQGDGNARSGRGVRGQRAVRFREGAGYAAGVTAFRRKARSFHADRVLAERLGQRRGDQDGARRSRPVGAGHHERRSRLRMATGRSRRTASGATVLGSAGASQAAVHSVETMLEAGDLSASVVYDIRPHLWGKLIANAAINPVAALFDRPNGVITAIATRPSSRGPGARRGRGCQSLTHQPPVRAILGSTCVRSSQATADAYNSMTCDLNAQRQTEIEQINGAIVAAGRRTGMPTPYNEAMLRLVKAKERVAEADF